MILKVSRMKSCPYPTFLSGKGTPVFMSLHLSVSPGDKAFTWGISGRVGGKGRHHSLTLSDYYHTGKFPLWLLGAGCEHIWSQQGTVRNLPFAEMSCRNLCFTEAYLQPAVSRFFFSCRAVLNCLLSHRAKTYPTKKQYKQSPWVFLNFPLLISLLMVWGLARSHLWLRLQNNINSHTVKNNIKHEIKGY